jgi:competence protein ComGC
MGLERSRQAGNSLIVVLAALLIVALLYLGRWGNEAVKSEVTTAVETIDRSREAACRTQRKQIERDVQAWTVNHDEAPTIDAMQSSGIRVPSCPEGGSYSISGGRVHCSVHGH